MTTLLLCRIQRMEGREIGWRNAWNLLTMRRFSMVKEVFRYIFARQYAGADGVWFRAECRVLKVLTIVSFALILAPTFSLFLPRG